MALKKSLNLGTKVIRIGALIGFKFELQEIVFMILVFGVSQNFSNLARLTFKKRDLLVIFIDFYTRK